MGWVYLGLSFALLFFNWSRADPECCYCLPFFFPQLPPSRSHVVAQWQRGRKHRVLVGGADSSHTERPERAQHCHTGTERTIWGQGSRCPVSLCASAFLPRPLAGPCFSLSSPFLPLAFLLSSFPWRFPTSLASVTRSPQLTLKRSVTLAALTCYKLCTYL